MDASFQAKYKILEKIGEGSFSEVLKCRDCRSGALYAAKRLKKLYQNVEEILGSPEIVAMRTISRHPNVLRMVESYYDTLPGYVTLVFELMDMSLYDLMKNRKGHLLIEKRVRNYVYQLLKGLEHLHKHYIFHRDIKPENILLKGNIVKIGDYGSVRSVYSEPPYTEYISTRWYRSPECLLTGGYYDSKMDVWAVGCVFYELLTLEPLFPGDNEIDQIAKIHAVLGTPHPRLIAKIRRLKADSTPIDNFTFPAKEGRGLSQLLPDTSRSGHEVIKCMLIYDAEMRPSVKRLLEHRYFTDLREREFTRQTRSSCSVLPSAPRGCGDRRQMFSAYFNASDRQYHNHHQQQQLQRRLRPLNVCQQQSQLRVPISYCSLPIDVNTKCSQRFSDFNKRPNPTEELPPTSTTIYHHQHHYYRAKDKLTTSYEMKRRLCANDKNDASNKLLNDNKWNYEKAGVAVVRERAARIPIRKSSIVKSPVEKFARREIGKYFYKLRN